MDDIPLREERVIALGLLSTIMLNGWRTFYRELPISGNGALGYMLIAITILTAQAKGEPLTNPELAAAIGIPQRTLRRRLAFLKKKKFVLRDESHGLLFNTAILATPIVDKNMRNNLKLIIEAAEALSKLATHSKP